MDVTPEEPQDTIAHVVQGSCAMPSSERWHCILTTKEREASPGLHLLDWKAYERPWGDEHVSTRHADTVPPDKALIQAEWVGSKIKHIASLPPQHPSDKKSEETFVPRVWKFNHLGLLYMGTSAQQGADDRSRTPLRQEKGKGGPKGKGVGKKGKKSGKGINPEGEDEERTGKLTQNRKMPLWRSSKGQMAYLFSWLVSDALERKTRVTEDFWSV